MNRIVALIAIVLSCFAAACSATNERSVPRILRGAHAGGGWWGACPPSSEAEAEFRRTARQLAISPELNSRLESSFPRGSPEQTLIESLGSQGFALSDHCKSDSTIRIATFHSPGRGFLAYATDAQVYWQADAKGRIVWTKGFVAYRGL